jgi:hypothetical protein
MKRSQRFRRCDSRLCKSSSRSPAARPNCRPWCGSRRSSTTPRKAAGTPGELVVIGGADHFHHPGRITASGPSACESRAVARAQASLACSGFDRRGIDPDPPVLNPRTDPTATHSTHLPSSRVMSIENAWRHSPGASRTTTRIGVGLKPLQGLFTWGQLEMTNSTSMSAVTST